MPLQLSLNHSIVGSILYAVVGVLSLAIVLLVAISSPLKLLLTLIIIASTIYAVLNHGLRMLLWSVVAIKTNNKSQLQLTTRSGQIFDVHVLNSTMVNAYLTILNCREVEATFWQGIFPHNIIILSYDVDSETYRKFRVWLRWTKF